MAKDQGKQLSKGALAAMREQMMAFADIALCQIRMDGVIMYLDLGMLKILDLEDSHDNPKELIGKNITSLFHLRWTKGKLQKMLIEKGELRGVEYPFQTLAGREKWIAIDAQRIQEGGGEAIVQFIARDITVSKQEEEALRESQTRYRHLTEAMTDYVFTVRVEHGKPIETIHSPTCVEITGYTAGEFQKDPYLWIRMVPYEDQNLVRAQAEAILAGRDAPAIEHRLLRKDGALRWVRNTSVAHHDAQGHITSYDGLVHDITDRKREEEALRANEQRFRLLIEHMGDTLFLHDNAGYILDVNQQACDSLGYSHDELLTLHLTKFDTGHDLEALQQHWAEAEPGHPITMESVYRRKDGSEFPVEIRVTEFESGARRMFLSQARDITKRVRAEEQRRELESQVQQAQKYESLGVLAGGIAHDFNNLLMSIMGNAELAKGSAPEDSPASHHLFEIERACRRAADLCQQMLAYSGRGRFIIEHANLSWLAEEAVHSAIPTLPPGIALERHWDSNLPLLEGDPIQLRQVVRNILANAIEAMEDKTGIIRLTTGTRMLSRETLAKAISSQSLAEGQYVFLEIRDEGSGMAPDMLPKIFDPFFTTKFMGRGLGLAAVLGIMRGHSGAILIESTPGKGSVFTILFPAKLTSDAPERKEHPAPQPWRGEGTILIIDDEDALRTIGQRVLERFGFTVITAADGEEGLERFLARNKEIAAIILDLTMPRMTGEEVLREIRRINPRVRVIITSGYSAEELEERFKDQNVTSFLQKPYPTLSLVEKLRQALETE